MPGKGPGVDCQLQYPNDETGMATGYLIRLGALARGRSPALRIPCWNAGNAGTLASLVIWCRDPLFVTFWLSLRVR